MRTALQTIIGSCSHDDSGCSPCLLTGLGENGLRVDDPLTESAKATQETAKAVQAVAETAGKAIDGARDSASFLARLFGGSLEQAAGILEDRLVYTQRERRQRLLLRARAFAKAHGLPEPNRQISLNILVPLLEAGASENDDELQDTWARMLLNAADADHKAEVRRAYVSILSDCTRLDIHVLATLYNAEPELRKHSVRGELLPEKAVAVSDENERLALSDEMKRSLGNLRRLGLISGDVWGAHGDQELKNVCITALGVGLVEACTLRDHKVSEQSAEYGGQS